ncbi:MAG: hypothetical protein AB1806_00150 [Acidobacteriota bacterium]
MRFAGERERAGERDGLPPATGSGLAAVALLLLACWACGGSVPGPQPIALGKDTCAKCRSVITTLDAAAQIVHEDGRVVFYDDLGCLATDQTALAGSGRFYVQFAGGKGWMRVEDVHFASPTDRTSPQGYNFFAYTEDEARQIDPDGWARGWGDLVEELGRKK